MNIIIAGSRGLPFNPVYKMIDKAMAGISVSEVVCGGARGVDTTGREWAERRGIPVKLFAANWDEQGKAAGAIRNKEMADYADAALIVWDGLSRGTALMIDMMVRANKPVVMRIIDPATLERV